jgi:hypothetical protein
MNENKTIRNYDHPEVESVRYVLAPLPEPVAPDPNLLSRAQLPGSEGGYIVLDRSEDGTVWVTVHGRRLPGVGIRFCTKQGGGTAPNTLRALYVLMEAIHQDGGTTRAMKKVEG